METEPGWNKDSTLTLPIPARMLFLDAKLAGFREMQPLGAALQ